VQVGDLVKRKRTGTLHLVLSKSSAFIHLSGIPSGQVFSPDEVEVISASR
jgi:hypothetical protein